MQFMKTFLYQLTAFLFFLNTFSQENFVKHKVVKGESLYSISKKYKVSLAAIAKENPSSNGVLKLNEVLLIPIKKEQDQKKSMTIAHTIKAKETLYGIAKKYKVSVAAIKANNPQQDFDNLKIGAELLITSQEQDASSIFDDKVKLTESVSEQIEVVHEVLPKETKYGISKKYGISIATLEKLNPSVTKDLAVGSKLVVKAGAKLAISVVESAEIESEKPSEIATSPTGEPYAVLIPIYERADLPDKLVATASENIGTSYRSGGKSKGGFDCSGLMLYTFGTYNVQLPRTSAEQAQFGTTITKAEAQKGDLIFFSTNGSGSINHVGMITEVVGDEIKFIHSSSSNGVIISSNQESYYSKCFRKIARVLK
jgi:peptidoglycan DL-endopeptidase LytE